MYKSRRLKQQMMRKEKQKVQLSPNLLKERETFLLEMPLIKKNNSYKKKNKIQNKREKLMSKTQMVSIFVIFYCKITYTHPKIQKPLLSLTVQEYLLSDYHLLIKPQHII